MSKIENRKTPAEIKEWYMREQFDKNKSAMDALDLTNIKKTNTKTVNNFSKENLRSYFRNIGSNEKNFRDLSRYLYYRSQVYYRIIYYFSSMFDLDSKTVIPSGYDISGENDKDKILEDYQNTLNILDKLNLKYEFLNVALTCFREDVFYGCVYFNEKSEVSPSMFILPLDPEYCKIQGKYYTGDFSFAMNMEYFRKYPELLEFWGEPFSSMYKEYEKTGEKWISMQKEYSACFKFRAEDWQIVLPPFSGLFNSLISLLDLEDIQAIADEQQIYKLLWVELETLTGTNMPDDWKVDPKIMAEYFSKMVNEALPDYTSAAIVPGKLNSISFNNDQATDTDKVQNATKTVLNTSGGAQILNSASISGTTAFNAAIRSDTQFALSSLLPQIESWLNRFLSYYIKNPARVKFFKVSVYTKDSLKESLRNDAQYGIPTKLAINSFNGYSEKESMAMNFLEEEILHLSDKFIPLSSSHTMSSDKTAGGQTKATDGTDDAITDEGEASQDKRDKSNG